MGGKHRSGFGVDGVAPPALPRARVITDVHAACRVRNRVDRPVLLLLVGDEGLRGKAAFGGDRARHGQCIDSALSHHSDGTGCRSDTLVGTSDAAADRGCSVHAAPCAEQC